MDIIDGLRRRIAAGGRRPRRPRRWSPTVTPLEDRTLQTVASGLGFIKADPAVLAPTGRYVTVTVHGEIGASHRDPPAAFFFVTDEYRTVEPRAPHVPLTFERDVVLPYGTWSVFSYSFQVRLQAKRSTRTFDGRHYDIFVGATDAQGTDGLTTQVFVPKVYHPATAPAAGHPKVAKHAGR